MDNETDAQIDRLTDRLVRDKKFNGNTYRSMRS